MLHYIFNTEAGKKDLVGRTGKWQHVNVLWERRGSCVAGAGVFSGKRRGKCRGTQESNHQGVRAYTMNWKWPLFLQVGFTAWSFLGLSTRWIECDSILLVFHEASNPWEVWMWGCDHLSPCDIACLLTFWGAWLKGIPRIGNKFIFSWEPKNYTTNCIILCLGSFVLYLSFWPSSELKECRILPF